MFRRSSLCGAEVAEVTLTGRSGSKAHRIAKSFAPFGRSPSVYAVTGTTPPRREVPVIRPAVTPGGNPFSSATLPGDYSRE